MFLGIKLLFLLIISPIFLWILFFCINNYKKIIGKIILLLFLLGFFLFVSLWTISVVNQKINLDKDDYYGRYIIDRNYFKGKQTDWQYDHFRFEITKDDSIFFYITEKEAITKTFKGVITNVKPFSSERLVIKMEKPTHHILTSNPTIYRGTWDFFMVFNSPQYYNMFFRKGKWNNIKENSD